MKNIRNLINLILLVVLIVGLHSILGKENNVPIEIYSSAIPEPFEAEQTYEECSQSEFSKLKLANPRASYREINIYRVRAMKTCSHLREIPAESDSDVESDSPAHGGPSDQGSPPDDLTDQGEPTDQDGPVADSSTKEKLPNFKPIAVSTPENGKIFISFKNVGGAYRGDEPIEYTVNTWRTVGTEHRSEIGKNTTNKDALARLNMGEPRGFLTKNIYDPGGVSMIVLTEENTPLEIRQSSSNPVHACINTNGVKESNTDDNCIFEWTKRLYSGDLEINERSLRLYNNRMTVVVQSSGDEIKDSHLEEMRWYDKEFILTLRFDRSKEVDYQIEMDAHDFKHRKYGGTRFYIDHDEIEGVDISSKHTVEICVDTENVLPETNETNNCDTFRLY